MPTLIRRPVQSRGKRMPGFSLFSLVENHPAATKVTPLQQLLVILVAVPVGKFGLGAECQQWPNEIPQSLPMSPLTPQPHRSPLSPCKVRLSHLQRPLVGSPGF